VQQLRPPHLHGVVDGQPGRDHATLRVDVHADLRRSRACCEHTAAAGRRHGLHTRQQRGRAGFSGFSDSRKSSCAIMTLLTWSSMGPFTITIRSRRRRE